MKDTELMKKCIEDAVMCIKQAFGEPAYCKQSLDARAISVSTIAVEFFNFRALNEMSWEVDTPDEMEVPF